MNNHSLNATPEKKVDNNSFDINQDDFWPNILGLFTSPLSLPASNQNKPVFSPIDNHLNERDVIYSKHPARNIRIKIRRGLMEPLYKTNEIDIKTLPSSLRTQLKNRISARKYREKVSNSIQALTEKKEILMQLLEITNPLTSETKPTGHEVTEVLDTQLNKKELRRERNRANAARGRKERLDKLRSLEQEVNLLETYYADYVLDGINSDFLDEDESSVININATSSSSGSSLIAQSMFSKHQYLNQPITTLAPSENSVHITPALK